MNIVQLVRQAVIARADSRALSSAGWMCFLLAFGAYHWIFKDFFPGRLGTLGHDWSWLQNYVIRYHQMQLGEYSLLAGDFFRFAINPSLCHGIVSYVLNLPYNPIDGLIAMGLPPLSVAYLQVLIFAAAGFAGMYLLLRRVFQLEEPLAVLGAVIYLFNGFYAHRALIGHGYFPAMLVPWLAFFLLNRLDERSDWGRRAILFGTLTGVVAFYSIVFGVQVIIVPVTLCVLSLAALRICAGGELRLVLVRSLIALATVCGLAATIIAAMIDNPEQAAGLAKRAAYSFPVIRSPAQTLELLWSALFFAPVDIESKYLERVTNITIQQQRHELEYGITYVPAVLLVAGCAYRIRCWLMDASWRRPTPAAIAAMGFLALVLVFPVVYTTNLPGVIEFAKKVPLLNVTTSPQREYFIYVVLVPVLALLAFAGIPAGRWRWPLVWAATVCIVFVNATKNREFYHQQPYDPAPLGEVHRKLKAGEILPPLERIGLLQDQRGYIVHDQMVEANLFTVGVQHMGCYLPGYGGKPQEWIGNLHPGSIWSEQDGYFNVKNPACNTWPKENNCEIAGHFRVSQKADVERYVRYRSFPIAIPERIRYASWITVAAYFWVLGVLLYFGVRNRRAAD